jgi:hypothetical protein
MQRLWRRSRRFQGQLISCANNDGMGMLRGNEVLWRGALREKVWSFQVEGNERICHYLHNRLSGTASGILMKLSDT